MVGQDFMFGDKHLRDFGFIMVKSQNDDVSGLNREILKGTTNMYRTQAVHYGTVFSDVITLPLFIIKYNCDYEDYEVSQFELRKLQAWLTSSKLPQPLYMYTTEGQIIEYRGIFTDIAPYSIQGLNGFNIVFTCDSPFVYDTHTVNVSSDEAVNGVTKRMYCDTDETEEYIYPYIVYHPNSSSVVSFKNKNDNDNIMRFVLPKKYDEIIIDCKLKRIIGDGEPLSLKDLGLNIQQINDYNNVNTGLYSMYWLRLLPERNFIDISGNGDFTITYKNLLKLGGLTYV